MTNSAPPVLIDCPKFPKDQALRQGTFRKYNDLLESRRVRGACQHGFASMLSLMSLAVDYGYRGNWLGYIPGRTYNASLGDTGSHKSGQSDPVAKLWEMISFKGEQYGQITGFTTDAGLFRILCANPAKPVFMHMDELQEILQATLLTGSVLTHYFNTLYSAPEFLQRNLSALSQRQTDAPIAEKPILALHGNIQMRAFWNAVGSSFEQASNGFLNRFCYFPADGSDSYPPRSKGITQKLLKPFKDQFHNVMSGGGSPTNGYQIVKLSPEAGKLWDRFNAGWDRKIRKHYYGAYRDMQARNRDHCARLAIIYAADEGDIEVTEDQMQSAIAVAEYLEESVNYILKHHDVAEGPQRISSIEENAVRFLKKLTQKCAPPEDFNKGWVSLRDIQNQFNSSNRPNSEELRKIIEAHELVDSHQESTWRAFRYRFNDTGTVWKPPAPEFDEEGL